MIDFLKLNKYNLLMSINHKLINKLHFGNGNSIKLIMKIVIIGIFLLKICNKESRLYLYHKLIDIVLKFKSIEIRYFGE